MRRSLIISSDEFALDLLERNGSPPDLALESDLGRGDLGTCNEVFGVFS